MVQRVLRYTRRRVVRAVRRFLRGMFTELDTLCAGLYLVLDGMGLYGRSAQFVFRLKPNFAVASFRLAFEFPNPVRALGNQFIIKCWVWFHSRSVAGIRGIHNGGGANGDE